MSSSSQKVRATRLAVIVSLILTIIKFGVGALTGSLSVIAAALDSFMDIVLTGVKAIAISHAEKPADNCHPFGHGKFEALALFFQAIVISVTGSWVVFEGFNRLGTSPEFTHLDLGIAVVFASMVISFLLSRHLGRIATEASSPSLATDSLHYRVDMYFNAGLLIAIVFVKYAGMSWLDHVFSICIGIYIISEALTLAKRGLSDVLDAQLPGDVIAEIGAIIKSADDHHIDYHNLRTRNAGSSKYIDFHLTVCSHLTIADAYEISQNIEAEIHCLIPNSDIIIHVDPCKVRRCPGRDNCNG